MARATFPQTLLILKPDAVQRRLVGRILARLEDKGLQIVAMKLARIPRALALRHYGVHRKKPFFKALIQYITSGPVVILVVQGKNVVAVTRKMMGATFGSQAEPGTIRGDFAVSDSFNLIHGSDSPAAARREIRLFFKTGEIHAAPAADLSWVYDFFDGRPA